MPILRLLCDIKYTDALGDNSFEYGEGGGEGEREKEERVRKTEERDEEVEKIRITRNIGKEGVWFFFFLVS